MQQENSFTARVQQRPLLFASRSVSHTHTHDQLHFSNDTLISRLSLSHPLPFLLLIFSLLIKNGSEARLSHYIHSVSSAVLQQDFIINRSRLAVWTKPLEAGFPRTAFYLR